MFDILIACERSGIIRDEFINAGYKAISCNLYKSDSNRGPHYKCDVRRVLNKPWRVIIAHPDCTYLTNSGVCWLHKDSLRWEKLDMAAEFFKLFVNHPCPMICIENPIPHKYALERIGRKYTQIIRPWMFGHTERKATCLWLKGLPELKATNNVKEEMLKLPKAQQQRIHYCSPGPERARIRSKTYTGIARAMVSQWAPIIDEAGF